MAFVGEAEDGNRIDFGDARRLKPTRPGRMVRVGVSPFEVDQRNSAQLFRRTKTETGIDDRCKLVGDQWGTRQARIDRKSVVKGKSVSVRVDLGGRSIIKKKTNTNIQATQN